jgi:hypothetical protein
MQKPINAHVTITGLFIILLLILAVPLIIITTQNPQDIRQRAASIQKANQSANIPTQNTSSYISGYIYLDQNQNGEREHAEPGAPNIQLNITENSNTTVQVITNQNGHFKYQLTNTPVTQTEITLILPEGHKTINTNPRALNIQNNEPQIVEFGIFPIQELNTVQTSNPALPNSHVESPPAASPTIFQHTPTTKPIAR